jgi:hypothetical protein
MQAGDHPGQCAGAGFSPTDPGAPEHGRTGSGGAGAEGAPGPDDDDLVSAVEDLVRDLLPDADPLG